MPMPRLFLDRFNRANGSNVGVDLDEQQGDWQINANRLETVSAAGDKVVSWKGQLPTADYRVSAKDFDASTTVDFGVAARITTGAIPDLYFTDFNPAGTMRLRKRIASVFTTIASGAVTRVVNAPMMIDVQGTALRAWYNGSLIASGTDAVLTAAGRAGCFATSVGAAVHRFDDLEVFGDAFWTFVPNSFHLRWLFSTEVVEYMSGFAQRNKIWTRPKGLIVMGYEALADSDKKSMQEFFMRRQGRAETFIIADPILVNPATEVYAVGDGVNTKYKILADWATAISTYTNGVLDGTQPTKDLFTGVLTYAAAPAKGAVLSADVTAARYRVYFAEDDLDFERKTHDRWDMRASFIQEKALIDGVGM